MLLRLALKNKRSLPRNNTQGALQFAITVQYLGLGVDATISGSLTSRKFLDVGGRGDKV